MEWSVPTAPGYGSITYKLEVDEGFGAGFQTLVEQTGLTYIHQNVIFAHMYTYRVSAKNAMGYGVISSEFQFSSRSVPEKPPGSP